MHDARVVIRCQQTVLRGLHLRELIHGVGLDVGSDDLNELIAIRAVLLVPEAERMHYFVNDGSLAIAAVAERDRLTTADSSNG